MSSGRHSFATQEPHVIAVSSHRQDQQGTSGSDTRKCDGIPSIVVYPKAIATAARGRDTLMEMNQRAASVGDTQEILQHDRRTLN